MEVAWRRHRGGVEVACSRRWIENQIVRLWMQVVNVETKDLVLGSTTTWRTIVLNDSSSLILVLAADAAGSDW